MGVCTGSPAAFSDKQQAENPQPRASLDDTSNKTAKAAKPAPAAAPAEPMSIPNSPTSKKKRGKGRPVENLSADCKRTSASTDGGLSRGSFEEMYKMSQHPEVNRNEGLSASGPDDMSTMYMSHMDRVLDLPKDSSKAFRM